jgi:hypothetical protein
VGKPAVTEAVRYSDSVTVRCQPEITALVDRAAKARGTRPAEYIRQALLTGLRLDGFDPAAIAPRDAGSLYNVVEGKQAYALIAGDRIADIGYHATEPTLETFAPGLGDRVLPVEYVDSEPFDIAKHWRLPPIDRIEADRVVREFQVVPKSWETV